MYLPTHQLLHRRRVKHLLHVRGVLRLRRLRRFRLRRLCRGLFSSQMRLLRLLLRLLLVVE